MMVEPYAESGKMDWWKEKVKSSGKVAKNTVEVLLEVKEMGRGLIISQMVDNGLVNGVMISKMVLVVINFLLE